MSLFDTKESWEENLRDAFAGFIASVEFVRLGRRRQPEDADPDDQRPLRPSSQRIYQTMFAHFCKWLTARDIKFSDVTHEHIAIFLDQPSDDPDGGRGSVRLASKIRVVYIRILERVFTHLKVEPNPASLVVLDKAKHFKRGKEEDKSFLTEAEIDLFMEHLPAAAPFIEKLAIDRSWKKRRDRAMLALMIGAGLKVSEVVAIETDSVGAVDATTGSVPINIRSWESDGTSRPHRAMLRPFAAKEVLAWREERKFLKIPGKLLFPSALKPKNRKTNQLNKATVYRSVKDTFVLAGIDVSRMGGRTLRNTFAIHELETHSPELVGEFLGHRKMRSTERYLPYTQRAALKKTKLGDGGK